jgi:hypothetical protein
MRFPAPSWRGVDPLGCGGHGCYRLCRFPAPSWRGVDPLSSVARANPLGSRVSSPFVAGRRSSLADGRGYSAGSRPFPAPSWRGVDPLIDDDLVAIRARAVFPAPSWRGVDPLRLPPRPIQPRGDCFQPLRGGASVPSRALRAVLHAACLVGFQPLRGGASILSVAPRSCFCYVVFVSSPFVAGRRSSPFCYRSVRGYSVRFQPLRGGASILSTATPTTPAGGGEFPAPSWRGVDPLLDGDVQHPRPGVFPAPSWRGVDPLGHESNAHAHRGDVSSPFVAGRRSSRKCRRGARARPECFQPLRGGASILSHSLPCRFATATTMFPAPSWRGVDPLARSTILPTASSSSFQPLRGGASILSHDDEHDKYAHGEFPAPSWRGVDPLAGVEFWCATEACVSSPFVAGRRSSRAGQARCCCAQGGERKVSSPFVAGRRSSHTHDSYLHASDKTFPAPSWRGVDPLHRPRPQGRLGPGHRVQVSSPFVAGRRSSPPGRRQRLRPGRDVSSPFVAGRRSSHADTCRDMDGSWQFPAPSWRGVDPLPAPLRPRRVRRPVSSPFVAGRRSSHEALRQGLEPGSHVSSPFVLSPAEKPCTMCRQSFQPLRGGASILSHVSVLL